MAMSQRDKIGLGVIIALMLALMAALALTLDPPTGNAKSPEESVFVQQRIKNLQK
jgi:hypothetical protein